MISRLLVTRVLREFVIMLMCLNIGLAGCTTPTPAPTAQPEPEIVIGVLLCMTEETPFFISLVEGAEEAAERLDVKLAVRYAHDDVELQRTQIQTLLDEGVSALLVNPVSDDIVPEIEAAAAAGVPVFTIDRSAPGESIVAHIASDNLAGGRMAGDYLAETLHKKGNVAELEGTPGASAAHDRGAGFNQAIATHPDIAVIARETANFNKADGKTVFAQILAEYPQIDGVFAHNDDMILGAIEAAKEAGRAEEIVFVGFDATADAIAAVERGDLLATIAQRPAEIGRLGIETAVKHLKGETVPAFIPVDLALVTQ